MEIPESEEETDVPEDEVPLSGMDAPETGGAPLWAVLAVCALSGLALTGTRGKKRKDSADS